MNLPGMRYFFINHNFIQRPFPSNPEQIMNEIAGNSGNSYISYTLAQILNIPQQKIQGISNIWTTPRQELLQYVSQINTEYSHAIIIMQDQIREHDSYYDSIDYKSIVDFMEKIQVPCTVVSLGHNSFNHNLYDKDLYRKIQPNLKLLLQCLSIKTVNIGTRGYFTSETLEKLGIKNTIPVGCPSLYANISQRKPIIKHKWHNSLPIGLTGEFAYLLSNHNAYYIAQDLFDLPMIKLEKFIDQLNAFDIEKLRQRSDDQIARILQHAIKHRIVFFIDMHEWEKFTSSLGFVVGTRLHGAIVSLNSGTPAVVTNTDSRSLEMCDFAQIPRITGTLNLESIHEQADFSNYENRLLKLYNEFIFFLHQNNTITSMHDIPSMDTKIKRTRFNAWHIETVDRADTLFKFSSILNPFRALTSNRGYFFRTRNRILKEINRNIKKIVRRLNSVLEGK